MLWSPHPLGTRKELCFGHGCSGHPELWFGHGCSGHRMLLEHERNYGLGMDALVTVCSWNTNRIMVWAWMLWSLYGLGTRKEFCFGHGCSVDRLLFENERNGWARAQGARALDAGGAKLLVSALPKPPKKCKIIALNP